MARTHPRAGAEADELHIPRAERWKGKEKMNITERNEKLKIFFQECEVILGKKGSDYNPDGTAFSEIKHEAVDLGLRPEQVMLALAGKHWGAIKTYVKTERLATEPIRERLKDLANYCALMAVMLEENQ